jgi:hypothetical protein
MNREHNIRIQELCAQIAVEQDQQTFLNLVEELNRVLGSNDRQADNNKQHHPKSG